MTNLFLVKKYITHPTKSPFNYQSKSDRDHNFCKLDDDLTSYCFSAQPGAGKEKCHPNCLNNLATATTAAPTPKPLENIRTLKDENSGRSQQGQNHFNDRINCPRNQVLNCEQTSVCDITINNPLREAFRVVIHPMAEVRLLESIRNGTHVNVDSIQPSSVWIPPLSRKNRVSFLCLPGGIEKGSNHSNIEIIYHKFDP